MDTIKEEVVILAGVGILCVLVALIAFKYYMLWEQRHVILTKREDEYESLLLYAIVAVLALLVMHATLGGLDTTIPPVKGL